MTPKLTVFGEVLLERPARRPPRRRGHDERSDICSGYGMDVAFISRVGHDELGTELLAFMEQQGLSTKWVQTGETHLTGIAKANGSDSNE